MEFNSRHIHDLPNEALELIFKNLNYTEVAQIRPTCKRFKSICCNLMSQTLRRFSKSLDKTLDKFQQAVWFKKENSLRLESIYRLKKGAHSLLQLSVIVNTADAATYHLIRDGYLPPFPAKFLGKVENAIKFATYKNPLVGKERMRVILSEFLQYYEENLSKRTSSPAAFQTIISLLESFPKEYELLQTTDYGMYYELSCITPIVDEEHVAAWTREVDAKTLMVNLVNMRLRTTSTLLTASFYISFNSLPVLTTCQPERASQVMFHKAEVRVWSGEKQTTYVNVARNLVHVRPDKFSVTIVGRMVDNQTTDSVPTTPTPIQLINYTYSCSIED